MSDNPKKAGRMRSEAERTKRRREMLLGVLSLILIAALTYAESRIIRFGAGIPVSNTILMFIIININLVLALFLLFLVLRNLAKLFTERRARVLGSRLRTKLILSFMLLAMIPTVALFFFSMQFINTSVEFWFNVPVEQSLENSLQVGRRFYDHLEQNHRFFIERIAYQIRVHDYMKTSEFGRLRHYIRVSQRAFNLDGVEVYTPNAERRVQAEKGDFGPADFPALTPSELMSAPPEGRDVRTFIQMTPSGELVRTVGNVPYKSPKEEAVAFVAVSTLLPMDLSEKMGSISRGFQEYRQLVMLKNPIKISNIVTLSIVAMVILFFSVWFGMRLSKSLTDPLAQLDEGTRRVAGGDLSFTLDKTSDDEMGSLVDSFNRMTRDLRMSRQELEYTAHQLAEQNVEIEERRRYMEVVLNNVSTGVVSLDYAGIVSTINKSAERMLGIDAEELVGKSYKRMLKGQHRNLVGEVLERIVRGEQESVRMPVKQMVNDRPKSFMVQVAALRDEAGRHLGMVVVFDDVSEQERAQRMAAWREVARRIAHEVKNPLTPIKLSAQRIYRKYGKDIEDPVFRQCTDTIIEQVDLIQNLVNEFSAYARFPAPKPVSISLPVLVREAMTPYPDGYPHISFTVNVEEEETLPRLLLDPQQMKRALINLIDNAIASIESAGGEGGCVTVSVENLEPEGKVVLKVADTGKGISKEMKTKLFEPYFSTKKAGMGLGLSIVSTIVTEHNGTIRIEDNEPRGACFVMEFAV